MSYEKCYISLWLTEYFIAYSILVSIDSRAGNHVLYEPMLTLDSYSTQELSAKIRILSLS